MLQTSSIHVGLAEIFVFNHFKFLQLGHLYGRISRIQIFTKIFILYLTFFDRQSGRQYTCLYCTHAPMLCVSMENVELLSYGESIALSYLIYYYDECQ